MTTYKIITISSGAAQTLLERASLRKMKKWLKKYLTYEQNRWTYEQWHNSGEGKSVNKWINNFLKLYCDGDSHKFNIKDKLFLIRATNE